MTFRNGAGNSIRRCHFAAPAPARERLRAEMEELATTDGASGGTAAPAEKTRLAELRARIKRGEYRVDLEALSRKIVAGHLKKATSSGE